MPQISVQFPGVSQPTSVLFTNTLGVLPSVAVISFLPQMEAPQLDGNLVVSDGINSMQWTGARLDVASLKRTTNGHIISAQVFDRRFWWKYRSITGAYNVRRPNGEIVPGSERTVRELAILLFEAMGEASFDVTALPNDSLDRPFMDWHCSNPAYELQRLCGDRGCNVAPVFANDTFRIVELGTGANLPAGSVKTVEYGYNFGDYPAVIRVCFGDTLYEAKIKLKAVGVDTDDTITEIEQLSYAPEDNWYNSNPEELIPEGTEEERELAKSSVFKLFRLESFTDDLGQETLQIPGGPLLESMDQIVPQFYFTETKEDLVSGRRFNNAAKIEGVFYVEDDDAIEQFGNTPPGTEYGGAFRIHQESGLVSSTNPIFKISSEEVQPGIEEPELYLHTAFTVRSNTNYATEHFEYNVSLTGGNGVLPLVHREHQKIVKANYSEENPHVLDSITPATDNQSTLEDIATALAEAQFPKFQTLPSRVVTYIGILPVEVDGLSRQVKFSVSKDVGANTTVIQNMEVDVGVLKTLEVERIIRDRQESQENITGLRQKERFIRRNLVVRQ
jgi:hypothetical protein